MHYTPQAAGNQTQKRLNGLEAHFQESKHFFQTEELELNQNFLECLGNIKPDLSQHDEL
jgi:hypothetical protein